MSNPYFFIGESIIMKTTITTTMVPVTYVVAISIYIQVAIMDFFYHFL